jgi:hypothetical protein
VPEREGLRAAVAFYREDETCQLDAQISRLSIEQETATGRGGVADEGA